MTATVREIVDEALTVMREVSGTGVQQFTEDMLLADAVRAFDLLFKRYPWDQYCQWFRGELDGTVGMLDADVFDDTDSYVRDFEDFISVHRDEESKPLPILGRVNPYILSGTKVLYWTSLPVTHANYAARRLRFYPATATGFVNIRARVYPVTTLWTWDDEMHLDKAMLSAATAYYALVGDDLNPGAAAAAMASADQRFRDIMANLANHPIEIRGGSSVPPTQWFISG